jgi:putative redox protein
MVEIQIVYEGELHTRAVHGPSGSALETDAPTDNEGRGERFSPTDLLATALGTCMLTVMDPARRRRLEARRRARARQKHMATARCAGSRLVLAFDMPALLRARPVECHTCR